MHRKPDLGSLFSLLVHLAKMTASAFFGLEEKLRKPCFCSPLFWLSRELFKRKILHIEAYRGDRFDIKGDELRPKFSCIRKMPISYSLSRDHVKILQRTFALLKA